MKNLSKKHIKLLIISLVVISIGSIVAYSALNFKNINAYLKSTFSPISDPPLSQHYNSINPRDDLPSSISLGSSASNTMDPPNLPILVNPDNPLPEDFTLNLVDMGEKFKFDASAAPHLQEMIKQAQNDGISLNIVSAYRSRDRQKNIFQNSVNEYRAKGYTYKEAYVATAKYIATPGNSEHSTGLAVDLNSLDESFDTTPEFKWLVSNCDKYGFILRYPKNKINITKISYEPWHYRYVGESHAKEIMSRGICLEEYLLSK